ncbi:lipopolysaccharide biosynthesis protein [Butyrivibrio sp. YAB3001]|uniref:lipopolysaccharide biosynthesis protein n=1 Tax=Butyrivibrio sp. YAB3001 TaxID=1520812 RepID=UPI0008F68229|nr:hypothetical protein [Butyrivibrio sp. YAB3001]SFC26604.1 Membrane protein involved in the export of O-antigen and teichoic acid [Butyrivibrio sp. YAB3001]
MRAKKALINTVMAILREIVVVICNFILPRLILSHYGSTYNGLISSIEQFLTYGNLMQFGIAGATRAALYKPISENNLDSISTIYITTRKFMHKLSCFFVLLVFIMICIYPYLFIDKFDWFFTASLVMILGINALAINFLGISYKAILAADQRQYLITGSQIACVIISTVTSVMLIDNGADIRLVKLVAALSFCLQPFLLKYAVDKSFKIDYAAKPDNKIIGQRWDAFAHQMATFAHDNTDVVILTLFLDLKEISVYAIYRMVVNGVKAIINSLGSGIEAAFGNMIARKQKESLNAAFKMFEITLFYLSGIVFSCAIVLILPFVDVYTKGVTDVDYQRPLFGLLFCIAELLWCIRIPYQVVTQAAGHYKQTRNGAIIEPIINIIISLCLVNIMGMNGVIVGTIIAMTYRTIQYSLYSTAHVLERKYNLFLYRIIVLIMQMLLSCFVSRFFVLEVKSYFSFFELALGRGVIIAVVSMFVAVLFDRKYLKSVLAYYQKR